MKEKPPLIRKISLILLLLAGIACRFSLSSQNNSESTPEALQILEPSPQPELTLTPTVIETPESGALLQHQWADSSADTNESEQAAFAIGEPDADDCELTPWESVWVYQSDFPNSSVYLELFYAEPIVPTQVNIHLAYTHTSIVNVSLIDLIGNPHNIYEAAPSNLESCPYVLTIDVDDFSDPIYAIRLDLDTMDLDTYGITAIDAVELVGSPLTAAQSTPIPTPYLTISSLGFNASDVPAGFVYFEIFDKNTNETLTFSQCDAFSHNLSDTEHTIRFFSCDDPTEIWLYLPLEISIGDLPLNTYPNIPTARLYYGGKYIPAMEGSFWLDQINDLTMTGVLEFKGFDPDNQIDYYGVTAVFNQIPRDNESAQKPGDMIVQWALDGIASSELTPDENAALQAVGPSDTWENCEGAVTAWKPANTNEPQWIELYFATPIHPVELNILFTDNPDSVAAVNLISATDYFPLDLETARVLNGCPTALIFDTMNETMTGIIGIQVMLDNNKSDHQPGIDAVQMIGIISD